MINPTTHAISEFSLPGTSMPLIAAGPGGNVWFTDSGTSRAIGMINPTHDPVDLRDESDHARHW